MVELTQLEQLVAFAQWGTLSRAAEELRISQPSLSRTMQRLEEEFRVPLFTHGKNRLILNENGLLAVDYAKRILQETQNMVVQVQAQDRSRRTISIGACAPLPLWQLPPTFSSIYPNMAITSEVRPQESLISGLVENQYQLIILPQQVSRPELRCMTWLSEQLCFCLPEGHPKADAKGLRFRDMDGDRFLLFAQIGFWEALCRKAMPHTRFLLQQEWEDFTTLLDATSLPYFVTRLIGVPEQRHTPEDRVVIPILDHEATVTYYCYYKADHYSLLQPGLQAIQFSRGV